MTSTRKIEFPISKGNIEDQIAAFLYATGRVNDDEEIVKIEFKTKHLSNRELVPLKIELRKGGV